MRFGFVILPTLLAISVNAQTVVPMTTPAPAAAPAPIKLGDVIVTGTLRSRAYAWDWFQPTAGNNEYQYSGNLLRVNFAEARHNWQWDAELAVPFLLGLPTGATGTGPQQGALGFGSNYASANKGKQNTAMVFPRQLYIQLDALGTEGGHLKIGRFTFLDGSELTPKNATLAALKRDRVAQRLLGDFGFSDVGRSFDGGQYSYSPSASDNLTIIAAVPTRGVFQVDGWGWNKIGFGYAAYTHDWGKGLHAADSRLFMIEYDDWRHILKTDGRPLAARTGDTANILINTFGGHTLHAFETGAGTINLMFWGTAQTGRWGVERQRAGAIDAEAGYQPKILPQLKPWVRGGYTWGSGDGTPNDSTHGTFFQLLPTPRPYARFPFFNMMNNQDTFGALILRPGAKVTISSEFHSLRLSKANDLWYSGGGAFQPWTFGYSGRSTSNRRSLGNLYDTNLEYRMNRKLTVTGYFGYTQGLAAMKQIYPKGKDGKFGYIEGLYRF
jgi:alginate export protein